MKPWEEPVMTIYLHPEKGQQRGKMAAIDILKEPNRHQFESIIKAMSVCIIGLVQVEEQRMGRISEIQKRLSEGGQDERIPNQIREDSSGDDQGRTDSASP